MRERPLGVAASLASRCSPAFCECGTGRCVGFSASMMQNRGQFGLLLCQGHCGVIHWQPLRWWEVQALGRGVFSQLLTVKRDPGGGRAGEEEKWKLLCAG